MELKSREREINESKIALSRLRQQLERTELEVQKEKDLRLRTNVDLAQILRQQAAIGAYNSSLVQAQQQQLQSAAAAVACEKEGILGAVKRPKFLHVEVDDDEVNSQKKVLKVECKTSPLMSPCAAESTECSPLREIACSKREESDEDPASSSSSSLSTTAAAVVRYSSSSHVIARKTSAASSPPVIVTVRATSRESTSPLAPPPSGTTREDSNGVSVKRQLTPTIDGALTPPDPRSTPSPSYSNESSATLVIVDSWSGINNLQPEKYAKLQSWIIWRKFGISTENWQMIQSVLFPEGVLVQPGTSVVCSGNVCITKKHKHKTQKL